MLIPAMILIAVLARLATAYGFIDWNLTPLMAVAFTSSAYLSKRYFWLLPVAILVVSDLVVNSHYGMPFLSTWTVVALLCYLIAAFGGKYLANMKSWASLFVGTVSCTTLFYLVSNTYAFFANPAYAQNFAGWVQSLTVGVPGYPPTWMFLRNSLIADLSFTLVFIIVMNVQRAKQGKHVLPIMQSSN